MEGRYNDDNDSVAALLKSLSDRFPMFTFQHNVYWVNYPGGSYKNDLIEVRGAGGEVRERISTNLALHNVDAAMIDLQHSLTYKPPTDTPGSE